MFSSSKRFENYLSFGTNFIGIINKTPSYFSVFEGCLSNLNITCLFGSKSHSFKSSGFVSHISEIPKTVFNLFAEFIFLTEQFLSSMALNSIIGYFLLEIDLSFYCTAYLCPVCTVNRFVILNCIVLRNCT